MRKARHLIGTIALTIAAALFCSGCPAMMVPGLAYSGYKYVHDKNNTQTASNTQSDKSTATAGASSTNSRSAAAQPRKIPDSDIE